MFRTYEFANIVYFILITVNAFMIWRLYRSMFSRDRDSIPDYSDEDAEALRGKSTGPIAMKYGGRLVITKIDSEIQKINN